MQYAVNPSKAAAPPHVPQIAPVEIVLAKRFGESSALFEYKAQEQSSRLRFPLDGMVVGILLVGLLVGSFTRQPARWDMAFLLGYGMGRRSPLGYTLVSQNGYRGQTSTPYHDGRDHATAHLSASNPSVEVTAISSRTGS
jgi:hypothetical protein